uniref:Ig-like domain-containing protein n=1 Tax=Meloidogyne incognita TaxID=6306 RepID=A0A914KU69_MELIC
MSNLIFKISLACGLPTGLKGSQLGSQLCQLYFSASDSATFPLQTSRPFTIEPGEENFLAREGEPGPLLNCSVAEPFRDRSRYELEWTKVVEDRPKLISRNALLYTPSAPDGYQLFDNVATDGSYNLRLLGVQFERDNGRFFCTLVDSGTQTQWLSEPARVVVLVPPQTPSITSQPTEAVREGDLATFRCESTGGNPTPRFQWLFDNKTKVPEGWYIERPEANAGKSISTLQMHVKSEHNGAYMLCQIWNRALKEGERLQTHTERLNVLYAPRVKILPSSELNVEEGQVVPLICKADANPQPTQFQWTHIPTGEQHLSREWHLAMKRIHTGEFRCTATNSIDTGAGTIRLNVLYGPSVRIKVAIGTDNPVEGERLVLECESDANPRVEAVSWSGPGGVKQNGSKLVIDSINRAHAGNFTCTSWNTLPLTSTQSSVRTGSSSIFIDVRRRPGPAVISAKRLVVNIGEPIILSCSTDGDNGNPPAKFKWGGPGMNNDQFGKEQHWNKAILKIPEAKLGDNGLYRCLPYNDIGQAEESSVRIMVVEPARLIRPLLPTRTLSSNSVDVQIECEARGFPRPRIFWLKDGQALPLDSSRLWAVQEHREATVPGCNQQREPCPVTVKSSLQLVHPTSWTDKGNYACIAENSPTAEAASSIMAISVVHEPIILNQKLSEGMAMASADIGEKAKITCLVSARPEPRIIWTRDGVEIAGGNTATFKRGIEQQHRYKLSLSRVSGAIDEFESVLSLDSVEEHDYGIFVCEASNGAGRRKSSVEIRFQPKGLPQTPIFAKQLQSGTDWILLGWRPGFDGGEKQTLELELRAVDPFTGRPSSENEPEHIVFGSGNWTTLSLFLNDDSALTETFLVYNITKLRPASSVWYRVRARNSRGTSDWTAISTASSEDVNESGGDIQAPESVAYLTKERKLVVQPLKYSAGHCALVYAASSEDGQMRSVNCFPLTDSDGSFPDIMPSERFKVRYCSVDDLRHCSASMKIFVDDYSSANSFWMLTLIIVAVCIISASILIVLICTRQRLRKAANAQLRARGPVAKGAMKRITLNGAAIERINGKKQNGYNTNSSQKNTPVNGSQSDSGVFTLGGNNNSSSAIASAVIALNGGINSKSCERDVVDSNDPTEWKEQQPGEQHQQQQHSFDDPSASQHQISPNQIEPSFDEYSNDPFLLQEFTNANSLGGIVCVENSLHQNSSAESTPGGIRQFGQQRPLNPYSKFFNEFSSAFLGGNAKSSIMRRGNGLDTSLDRKQQINNEGYNQQQQQLQQNELNNPSSSNEQLLQSNNGSCSSNNSSISPYGNNGRDLTTKINNSNNNGVGGRASGRREIEDLF